MIITIKPSDYSEHQISHWHDIRDVTGSIPHVAINL
jgi:hypothetical protein